MDDESNWDNIINALRDILKHLEQEKTIWIGISENDLSEFRRELVHGNEVVKWAYKTEETNELINVHFMSEDELLQRGM